MPVKNIDAICNRESRQSEHISENARQLGASRSAMGLVMIKCPITGHAISTGLEASRSSFNRSPVFFGRTFCPACRRDHQWFAKDAWVNEPKEKYERRRTFDDVHLVRRAH